MVDKGRHGPRDKGIRRLSYKELIDRRQKGLCFKCGGTYHPSHTCPNKIILEEHNMQDEEEVDSSPLQGDETDDDVTKGNCSILSLQSLVKDKSNHSHTLKLR